MAPKAKIHDAKKVAKDGFIGGIWFACTACKWQSIGHPTQESILQSAADKHNRENNK